MKETEKASFLVYYDWGEHLELLSDKDAGRLFKDLISYASTGKTPELEGRTRMVFSFMAAQMDREFKEAE